MQPQKRWVKMRNYIFWVIGVLIVGIAVGVELMVNSPETAPFDLLPPLLRGLATTVELTVLGATLALVVALIAGIARSSRYIIVRAITGFYVEIFRGTSILVQLFWIFFVLPFFGITLSPLQAGVLALGLNVGAYGAEVVRGAIKAIPRGQIEASIALNMSSGLMMRRVIIPQATVRMLPPFGNLLIELLKATSLVSLITLSDVTFQALSLRQSVGRTTEVFLLILVIYFLLAYPLTLGVRWLERRRQWATSERGSDMSEQVWDWSFAIEILPVLLEGLIVTVEATIAAFAVAAVLGLLLALGRRSENQWLAQPVGGLVEFVRSTPLLVQLYIFFFVLPRYGLRLPAFVVGVIVLGLHYGTYCSEVYRAGIDATDEGQWEAAKALNFSPTRTWVGIILPQAIPPMFPALGNYLVAMFKESAQLSAITVVELTLAARIIGTETFRFLEPFTMAGMLYFLISYPSSLFVQRLEARYARKQ